MGHVAITQSQLLENVFDLRVAPSTREQFLRTLFETGAPLGGASKSTPSEIELPKYFLTTGAPCLSEDGSSAYFPMACRVYPKERDRLPFTLVASANKWDLATLEIVAYPRVDDLAAFRRASYESTLMYGPGDSHPGSLGVLAFSLAHASIRVEYLQSSVNYRKPKVCDLVNRQLARKYGGWQTEVVRRMADIGEGMNARSVIIKAGARLSESVRNFLATAFRNKVMYDGNTL